jgi:hypothetical protein
MDLWLGVVEWIQLAQDRRRAVVNMVMNLPFPFLAPEFDRCDSFIATNGNKIISGCDPCHLVK